LVSGVGNALKGDDAFGVKAAVALQRDVRLPAEIAVLETGIGGIHLVQELMQGYDALIIFDACDRGDRPGKLFVLEPDLPGMMGLSERHKREFFADVHYATPFRALTLAREIGCLPKHVRIIACQVAESNAFKLDMHPAVSGAIAEAVDMAFETFAVLASERNTTKAIA
jgi:hydrogenase maturation protease